MSNANIVARDIAVADGSRQAIPAALPPARTYPRPGSGPTTAITAVTVIALLLGWWGVTAAGLIAPLFLPPPSAVWQAAVQAWEGNVQGGLPLLQHIAWSLWRVFGAFLLAAVTAVPVGLLMGSSRVARGIVDPLLEFYRPLPPLAYLPLIVIWFGIDETAKLLLIYLACFAPIAVSTRAGVAGVPGEQLHAALSMGASRWQLLRHVILPAALPDILTGLRIAIGFGWTTLVAAEMVAATAGLGQLVLNASNFLRTDVVVMGIVLIGLIAYLFDLAMRRLSDALTPWRQHR
ncbi:MULTISPECIES: ABC transporter permease subunit [unclassified Herbaspirillum]|uniref:ABC transporter permease subunit n=1 Tax=unclassified Herbaspirillum TaxID=2624150 RepID=UPI0011516EF6|nr:MULTISPECIES: ABC transporter permease subunit [unclassified Herbaspirillum]MBB5391002.1 taurine transport system permease protein [Herbaspirillum sp. SJZ102]TQK06519.1 taurine transport system permease protein [Herbaspirillum sp. SJZ130]TQK12003.1 taurine transport system permease protein [Herbaspirillum sp. SJZ106]